MIVPDSNKVVVLTGENSHSTLLNARLHRQRGEMVEARLVLEKAMLQWPHDEEIREFLLQTEKDQLALKREKKKGSDGAGLLESPWQLVFFGFVGIVGAAFSLYMISTTIVYLVHHGINTQMEVRSRVEVPHSGGSYTIPVYSELTTWFVFFCLCLGLVVYAVRSYRA